MNAQHAAESDAYQTNWDRPCPACKAAPGKPCRRPNGDKFTTYTGAPRFHAARQRRRVIPPGGMS